MDQYFGLPEVPLPSFLSPLWSVRSTEEFQDAPVQIVERENLKYYRLRTDRAPTVSRPIPTDFRPFAVPRHGGIRCRPTAERDRLAGNDR